MKIDYEKTNRRIFEIATEKGISREQLQDFFEINQSEGVEKNPAEYITVEKVYSLSRIMKMKMDDLLVIER